MECIKKVCHCCKGNKWIWTKTNHLATCTIVDCICDCPVCGGKGFVVVLDSMGEEPNDYR